MYTYSNPLNTWLFDKSNSPKVGGNLFFLKKTVFKGHTVNVQEKILTYFHLIPRKLNYLRHTFPQYIVYVYYNIMIVNPNEKNYLRRTFLYVYCSTLVNSSWCDYEFSKNCVRLLIVNSRERLIFLFETTVIH